MFANDWVRVWDLRLAPGEQLARHIHRVDNFFVVISGGLIRFENPEDSSDRRDVQFEDDQVTWVNVPPEGKIDNRLTNVGDKAPPQLPDRAAALGRAAAPGRRPLSSLPHATGCGAQRAGIDCRPGPRAVAPGPASGQGGRDQCQPSSVAARSSGASPGRARAGARRLRPGRRADAGPRAADRSAGRGAQAGRRGVEAGRRGVEAGRRGVEAGRRGVERPTPPAAAAATPAAQARPAAAALQGKLAVVRQAAAIGMPGTVEPVQAAWVRALELYQKAQPGVSIDETTIPPGDFSQMMQFITAQQAAATLPDLVNHWVGPTNREEDENKSPWVRTTDHLDATNPYTGQKWRDDFEPDVLGYQLGTLKYNYALAVDRNAISWVYNKTMFDQKGWKVPQTYSEFMKLLAEIKKAGVTPIAEYASPSAWITNHPIRIGLYSMQRPLWAKLAGSPETRSLRTQQLYEGYSCGVLDYKDPGMQKAFELAKYVNKHAPPGHSSLNRQQTFEMFWAQQGAMIWFSTDLIVIADRLKESGQLKFEWDTFPTPPFDKDAVGDAVKPLPVADISERGRQWAIPAKSFRSNKNDKAEQVAIDFLRFIERPGGAGGVHRHRQVGAGQPEGEGEGPAHRPVPQEPHALVQPVDLVHGPAEVVPALAGVRRRQDDLRAVRRHDEQGEQGRGRPPRPRAGADPELRQVQVEAEP